MTICLGKSTYARCGIIVNVTPLEPEWEGYVTLEFSNTTPLPAKIYANEGVAQMIFFEADQECERVIRRPRRQIPGSDWRHAAQDLNFSRLSCSTGVRARSPARSGAPVFSLMKSFYRFAGFRSEPRGNTVPAQTR